MSVNISESPEMAVIGGSGFYEFDDMESCCEVVVDTPYSEDVTITIGQVGGRALAFIARHGSTRCLPPHKINYRANIWALKEIGVKSIISVNAVGGISAEMSPGMFVLPNQIIDYTHGREGTFVELLTDELNYVSFTQPFSETLRERMIGVFDEHGVRGVVKAVYGCTQGPRLESTAEINRMERDGCDIVGMTGMPEAVLARELGMEYVMLSTVVNWAAGRVDIEPSIAQIKQLLNDSHPMIRAILVSAVSEL